MTEKRYAINFTPTASEDLEWLSERLNRNNSPEAVQRFFTEMFQNIELLRELPFLGTKDLHLEKLDQGHRYLLYKR